MKKSHRTTERAPSYSLSLSLVSSLLFSSLLFRIQTRVKFVQSRMCNTRKKRIKRRIKKCKNCQTKLFALERKKKERKRGKLLSFFSLFSLFLSFSQFFFFQKEPPKNKEALSLNFLNFKEPHKKSSSFSHLHLLYIFSIEQIIISAEKTSKRESEKLW